MAQGRPFGAFEWMISLRYLRARRKEGFISVIAGFSLLGVMLGVATLIIVMAVMNGFRSELMSKILGINGHMIIQTVDDDFSDFDEIAERLRAVEGVRQVMPLVEGQVMAATSAASSGAIIRGMRERDILLLSTVSENVRQGSFDGFDRSGGIALGARLARQLGVISGEHVSLISPRGPATPFGTAPRVRRYPVVAIFEMGMSEYDSSFIFMPLSEAQNYFNQSGRVSALELMLDDPNAVEVLRDKVYAAAARPLFIVDWRQRNQTFFSALEVERNVMFLILTLIVLVAAFNIISGLIMLVKDKSSDIAVLRTMGATRGAVMRIFFIAGASIGAVGSIGGLVLGVVVCLNIESIRKFISSLTGTELFSPELYYLSQLPAEMDAGEVVTVVIMALSLSFIATLYPAWRAARLDPIEALRYE